MNPLKQMLLERPDLIVKSYLKDDQGKHFICTPYQSEFLKDVILKLHQRYIFCASTRSGKSEIIAITTLILMLLYPKEEVVIISYTDKQSKIIFNSIRKHIYDSPEIFNLVDLDASFTMREFAFKNGSKAKCMTAGNPEGLLGFGGTVVILDECGSIDDETYNTKILRMIATGRRPRILIECGTPHKDNHFKKTWISAHDCRKNQKCPDDPLHYTRFHVSWRQAVEAGQMDEAAVLEIKKLITQREFDLFYEAKFPEQNIDALIKLVDWMAASERGDTEPPKDKDNPYYLGVDVARFGADSTVYTILEKNRITGRITTRDILKTDKEDLMSTTGRILVLDQTWHFRKICVDDTGLGGGVTDRLREHPIGNRVQPINFGAAPISAEALTRAANLKAEIFLELARMFETQLVDITPHTLRGVIGDQCLSMKYKFTSAGKCQIVDPETKSPDFADSLALAIYASKSTDKVFWGGRSVK